MKRIIEISVAIFFLLRFFQSAELKAQAFIAAEGGVVLTEYNDVRIPGDKGTLFSLKDDLNSSSKVFYRVRAGYMIKSRHFVSLLFAPLEIKVKGNVPFDIVFENKTFPANSDIDATYKFNSYRLTYRYDIVQKPKFEFGLGLTAKIRDARIALSNSSLYSEKVNVGFVPIINFRFYWNFKENFGFLLEGDALVAKQGRAEDVLIAVNHKISDQISILAGYRILEGGADNNTVYNFSMFNYLSMGLNISF
jgi:hypothetical protein